MENEEQVEGVDTTIENNTGESEATVDTIAVPKSDYEKLNQTLGSLKRELKDLKKSKNEAEEIKADSKPNENSLIEKAFLRSAQITHSEDVELAISTAKKWGVSVDALVDDADFQVKLEKARTNRANVSATSNIKGSGSTTNAKNTPEHWIAKGTPPTPADVPNRADRMKIINAMMAGAKGGKKFYND